MNADEARRRLAGYLDSDESQHQQDKAGLARQPQFEQAGEDWVAWSADNSHCGVRLKADGTNVPIGGALGKLIRGHGVGLPVHREYHLGSAAQGRYQLCESGIGVWEASKKKDIGYAAEHWDCFEERARTREALIAFFDLRGFTNWSHGKPPHDIQVLVERFEESFQMAFSGYARLFAKGTGDGLMVVSEDVHDVVNFCVACARTVELAEQALLEPLAVGCGVTMGEVTALWVLGRFDYIGAAVNDASKIQAIAFDELCLSDAVVAHLARHGVTPQGHRIRGKGLRLAPADLTKAWPRQETAGPTGPLSV